MLTAISIALILSSQCGKSKTNFFLFGFSPYFQARGLLEFLDHHIHTKFGIKSTLIFIIRLEQRHDNFNQNFITPISIVVLFRNFWLRSRQFIDDLTLVGDAATYHEHNTITMGTITLSHSLTQCFDFVLHMLVLNLLKCVLCWRCCRRRIVAETTTTRRTKTPPSPSSWRLKCTTTVALPKSSNTSAGSKVLLASTHSWHSFHFHGN